MASDKKPVKENLTSLEKEFEQEASIQTDLLPNSAEIAKETVEKEKGLKCI